MSVGISTRKVSKERKDKVLNYIDNSGRYELKKFFEDNSLLDNYFLQGANYMVSCPYHTDSTPSLSVDFEHNRYRCFGCGIRGRYLNFVIEYTNYTTGSEYRQESMLEKLLREDRIMQQELHFNSIYIKSTLKDVSVGTKRFKPDLSDNCFVPKTYSELANKLKRLKISNSDVLTMVALIQSGMAPPAIYKELTGKGVTAELQLDSLNIADIIGGK